MQEFIWNEILAHKIMLIVSLLTKVNLGRESCAKVIAYCICTYRISSGIKIEYHNFMLIVSVPYMQEFIWDENILLGGYYQGENPPGLVQAVCSIHLYMQEFIWDENLVPGGYYQGERTLWPCPSCMLNIFVHAGVHLG
jgi:hypothetical protein